MFINHLSLKIAGRCFVTAGLLLVCLTAAQAQGSRAESAASYFSRGQKWHTKGEIDRAIKLNPRHASAWSNRGDLRFSQGDYDGALADHSHAIELNPRLAESYNNRANARYAKGDYEGALADYNQALAIKPDYAYAYSNRGIARLRRGQRAEAEADFAQRLALKPDMRPSLDQRIRQVEAKVAGKQ